MSFISSKLVIRGLPHLYNSPYTCTRTVAPFTTVFTFKRIRQGEVRFVHYVGAAAAKENRSISPSNFRGIVRRNHQSPYRQKSVASSFARNFFNARYSTTPKWPLKGVNTGLNITAQGSCTIIERFGKFHSIEQSGLFLAIPFVDTLAYIVDSREITIDIHPQKTITKDNVQVAVSGNIFMCFNDPYKAAYGAQNPYTAISSHAQSAMRSAIGRMDLDELLHNRSRLNEEVKDALNDSSEAWGIIVTRYELTEIAPDKEIAHAMDKQAAAKRMRREQVLGAEGDKRSAILKSEGLKQSLINESEGDLISARNEAEANKVKIVKEAEARAESIMKEADATVYSIEMIAETLKKHNAVDGRTKFGDQSAQINLAKELIKMNADIGSRSNTIFYNDKPADMNSLMTQASLVMKNTPLVPTE